VAASKRAARLTLAMLPASLSAGGPPEILLRKLFRLENRVSAALFKAIDTPLVSAIKANHHHSIPSLVGPRGAFMAAINRLRGFTVVVEVSAGPVSNG
jgi:hypothetical protein